MLGKIPAYLPKSDVRQYRLASAFLYLGFFVLLFFLAQSFLFPYSRYSFDFNNPDANKNTLFEPHLSDFSAVTKGKVPGNQTLSLYAYNPHILETGTATLVLGDSVVPALENSVVTVRRGFAATFFPAGEELDMPKNTVVEYQGGFYQWQENTLFPLVSQSAAESWVPKDTITSIPPNVFGQLTVSEEIIGFRPGTLLAYADGVFFVTEENTIRPFGSAEVLLRAGYSFDHILPASGEDVGIYKRGKIILPGELHPGGTLFYDTDSRQTFLFQNKKMNPLTAAYGEFLGANNDRINFSRQALTTNSSCQLQKKTFQNAYYCQFPLLDLRGAGYDYQIAVAAPAGEIDVQHFQLGLQSSRKSENARATARSLANRVLERVGLY